MLRSFTELTRFDVRATDGPFGSVSDLYFDDVNWSLRYCVVDSGSWFSSRYLLIAKRALSILDSRQHALWVRLSRMQIKGGPTAASDKPVSKQPVAGVAGPPAGLHPPDRHLRSCRAVIGHRLEATDGRVGRVRDFLLDDKTWTIQHVIVDIQGRGGQQVFIATQHVRDISWPRRLVSVALTSAGVLQAPAYGPAAH